MSRDKPDNESFVSRWSRRKSSNPDIVKDLPDQERQEPNIPLNTITPDGSTGRMITSVEADRIAAESAKDAGAEKVLTDADMPDIESLDEHSDYTGFMSPGVSSRLRKLALRKLFAGAGFNIRDGLDDYDDDFTGFTPLGDLVTSDMKHRQEMEEKRRQEALAEAQNQEEEEKQEPEQGVLDQPERAVAEQQADPGEVPEAVRSAETDYADAEAEGEELVDNDGQPGDREGKIRQG